MNKKCSRKVTRSSFQRYVRTYITQSRWYLLFILLPSSVRRFLLYRSGYMSAAIPGRKARGYESHLSPPTPLVAAASAEVIATLNIPSCYQTASVHTHHTHTHTYTHTQPQPHRHQYTLTYPATWMPQYTCMVCMCVHLYTCGLFSSGRETLSAWGDGGSSPCTFKSYTFGLEDPSLRVYTLRGGSQRRGDLVVS